MMTEKSLCFTKKEEKIMRVNGKEVPWQQGMTLEELLCREGFVRERIAVECNGEIVPKAEYAGRLLTEADELEVVSFVGGG